MSLAAKLPYDHPFAGGYPGIGSQPLPTDADALDYLSRVKAADGAGVEVGVATAVDAFFRGLKADSLWDALKASCIMCGARTISGALVPLVGAAPTPYNFVAADYDRSGGGLKGDGSTKYLDSNRANDADGQDDQHLAIYVSSVSSDLKQLSGCGVGAGVTSIFRSGSNIRFRSRSTGSFGSGGVSATGLYGVNRGSSSVYDTRIDGTVAAAAAASEGPASGNVFVFLTSGYATPIATDARLAFYSIGASLDLAALDNRVSTLVAAIAAAL